KLGTTWTCLVVLQVALSTAVLLLAGEEIWVQLRPNIVRRDFAPEQYVTAKIVLEDERPSSTPAGGNPRIATRFPDLQTELVRQVKAGIGVSGETVSASIDGIDEDIRWIETDVEGQKPLFAGSNQVDGAYFDVFKASLQSGRTFEPSDFNAAQPIVVVNRTFAEQLSGQNPVGKRLRYLRDAGPWYEIVGLVDEIAFNTARPRIYHPMLPGQTRRVSLTLRVGPTVTSGFARRLLAITTMLDPNLHVEQLRTLDDMYQQELRS